ncbi:MAG: S8 family peptidase [Candidatus Heimdallarchaeaceae archaeon]
MNVQSSNPISVKENNLSLNDIFGETIFLNQFTKANHDTEFRVVVKISPTASEFYFEKFGHSITRFHSFQGLAISISKEDLLYLIHKQMIREIWNNSLIYGTNSVNELLINDTRSICDYNEKIGSDSLWNMTLYGDGVKIAILDTGLNVSNPALNQTMGLQSRIAAKWNFLQRNEDVFDDNGHGTEVAGIIGSNGLFGYMQGVAPNSKFLIGKILDSNSIGTVETLIQGIDWALDNNADVINLSLGKIVSNLTSPEVEAVNCAVESGVLVCVSTGNARGTKEFGYSDLHTVLSPGIASKAITVGAIDNNDVLYEHSSAGPVAINFDVETSDFLYDSIPKTTTWLKPDVVAPGVLLNTTSANGKDLNVVSGTSYATAVVSGICLLLKQQYYDADPSLVKASIIKTCIPLSLNAISPFLENIIVPISPLFQGSGLVNSLGAFSYINTHDDFTLVNSVIPYLDNYYFKNSETSFNIQLYIHQPLDNIKITPSENLADILYISPLPKSLIIGQYDLEITINTEQALTGFHRGLLSFECDDSLQTIDIEFNVKKAYGRILLDYREDGNNIKYSLNGNLRNIITLSKKYGLIPIINSQDIQYSAFSTLDLNEFEVIALINSKNTLSNPISNSDIAILSDYINPEGVYSGGSLIVLPSRNSDFNILNQILSEVNITYFQDFSANVSLDVSSSYNILLSEPYFLNNLYLPYPVLLNITNANYNPYSDKLVYGNQLLSNGSIVVGGNTLDMFLDSPYLYSALEPGYSEIVISAYYGDNDQLLENMISSTVVRGLSFNYSLMDTEISIKDNITLTINSANLYKVMPFWEFYMTISDEYGTYVKVNPFESYGNGTTIFNTKVKDMGIPAGSYTLKIHSFSGTNFWDINIIASVSLGPVIISISLVLCISLLTMFRKKSKK